MDLTQVRDKIIAVDFDGTITLPSEYPITGEPNMYVVNWLRSIQTHNKIILWTCREGKDLDEAIDICTSLGIVFDAINSNIDKCRDSRKIYAHYYIDDKAINVSKLLEEEN